jgi:hypothetical protein
MDGVLVVLAHGLVHSWLVFGLAYQEGKNILCLESL